MWLDELVQRIGDLDRDAMREAHARQDALTKPKGSLGRLESLAIQVAGITGTPVPMVQHKVVITWAADHGVANEGVSAYPQSVTAQMIDTFLNGRAAVCVLARQAGARHVLVDVGIAGDMPPRDGMVSRRIASGTRNMMREPAMTREKALASMEVGAEVVRQELASGLDVLALGEIGIGNTTSATAIASVLSGDSPDRIVGPGSGLNEAGVARKLNVVQSALALHRPNRTDPVDVLAKVGGFEIGALVGATLEAAAQRRPVVVDGFPATAAVMLAVALAPSVRDFLITAHQSGEPGHARMLEWLDLDPLFNLQMRLGEGTGALLGLYLLEAACRLLREMPTFAEAQVSNRVPS